MLLKNNDGSPYAVQCVNCGKVYGHASTFVCECGGTVMCVTSATHDEGEIFTHVGRMILDPSYRAAKRAEYDARQSAKLAS